MQRTRRKHDDGRDGTVGMIPGCPYPNLDNTPTKELNPNINTVFFGGGLFPLSHWILGKGYHEGKMVFLSPFYISLRPVSILQWEELMGSYDKKAEWQKDDDSVKVDWMQAIRYCNLLSRQAGLDPCYTITNDNVVCDWNANAYRLPTEAEFNYATPCYVRRITEELDCIPKVINLSLFSIPHWDVRTRSLVKYTEHTWMWDVYERQNNPSSALIDPTGPDKGDNRTLRHYNLLPFPSNNAFKPIRYGRPVDYSAQFFVTRSWIFNADVRQNNQLVGIPQWDRYRYHKGKIYKGEELNLIFLLPYPIAMLETLGLPTNPISCMYHALSKVKELSYIKEKRFFLVALPDDVNLIKYATVRMQ